MYLDIQGKNEYLVLWKGWPNEASQWLTEDDISRVLIQYVDYLIDELYACMHAHLL